MWRSEIIHLLGYRIPCKIQTVQALRAKRFMIFTSDSAQQFLLSKLDEQASRDGIALDEIEKKMFLFSESSGAPDFETQEEFDREYSSTAYESKVAKLLRRSYARDKKMQDAKREWSDALNELGREDFYGLAMVDQAEIPRKSAALWAFGLQMLPFVITELAVTGIGFVVVFEPYRINLFLPDWIRLLLFAIFVCLVWYVGKVFGRIEMAKSLGRSHSD